MDFESLDTNAIYWSLIEAGLAIIAACLPTFSILVSNKGLRSAIERARSALSLNSLFSNVSRRQERLEGAENLAGKQPKDLAAQDACGAMTRSNIGESSMQAESDAVYGAPRLPEGTLKQVNGVGMDRTLTQGSQLAHKQVFVANPSLHETMGKCCPQSSD